MKTLILLLLMNGTTTMDWAQTRYAARHPAQFYEINPIIGKHPSVKEVDRYFIGSLAVKNTIFFILPEKYQPIWAMGMTTISVGLIAHNNSIGIQMKF